CPDPSAAVLVRRPAGRWWDACVVSSAVDTAQSQRDDQANFVPVHDQGAPMTVVASQGVSFATLLKLGRVSNLPTVWTNVLAGTVLAGGDWRDGRFGIVLVAMSVFYIGGMYLNDYFDRAVDARERPTRPIPAGEISAAAVAAAGAAMLASAIALMAAAGT